MITQGTKNQNTQPQALLIRNHKIAYIGSTQEIKARAHKNAQMVDLGRRRVIAGLVDSHIYAIRAGLNYMHHIDWGEVPRLSDALERITQAAQLTDTAWLIVAGGWNTQQFDERRRPTLSEIERAAPQRLIYIQHAYNVVLLSTAALRELNLTDDAHLPEGAHFERDVNGARTGWIIGKGPAIITLYDLLPHSSATQHIKGTQAFFRRLNSSGITGVIDPGGHNLSIDEYDGLFTLAKEHKLTLRINYSAFAPRPATEQSDLMRISHRLIHHQTKLLRYNGLGENIYWGFYNNNSPSPQQIKDFERIATWAARAGERVTLHWNNDASISHVLDVYERINKKFPLAPMRWSIHPHSPQLCTWACPWAGNRC